MSLYFRILLKYLTFALILCVAVVCTHHKSVHDNLGSQDSAISNDSCNVCAIDQFYVKRESASDAERIIIDEPVAVQFFNRIRLAEKYDNNEARDTLMEIFGNRDRIQDLADQFFYFRNVIKPILINDSINVVDTPPNDRVLEFRGAGDSFFVNSSQYKDQDGVLFFTPGKMPIFWTVDGESRYCKVNYGVIVTQYFLCPESDK